MDLQDIEKYYINLDYEELKSKRRKASMEIYALCKKIKLKHETFVNRLEKTVLMLENHMPLLKSICNHTDVPEAIVTYINYYRINIYKSNHKEKQAKQEVIWTLILTLLNFCARDDVQYFLETCIITNSLADNDLYNNTYKELLSHQTIEIIVLDDSDLYAVIKSLKLSENTRKYLSKIWVSESIECNFLSLMNEVFSNSTDVIRVFKSKQELLTPAISCIINVTSIWSEDIAAAKNLATSLDRNIVLINMLDFYETMIVIPYIEMYKSPLCNFNINDERCIVNMIKPICSKKKPVPANPIYNYMFYDGTWQKPIQNTYWLHNNILRANATKDDMSRCFASAKKGFKIWSELSTESRTQILSKFAFLLEYISKPELSEIVFKWIKFPLWYKNSLQPQSGRSLVVRTRKPKGVITLVEKKETNLFRKLTQSLIIGNSVVVICPANSCNIIEYCNLFLSSGIPPGVINMLTCESIKPLNELRYDALDLNEIYYQFTVSKQVATMI